MKHFIFSLAVFFAASSMSFGSTVFTEGDGGQGDAGGLPSNANITVGGGTLTDIVGTLTDQTGGADMYEIYIADPSAFSATTTGTGKNPVVNPSIYLFDASGDGLFGNDNISGTNFQASIPLGTTDSLAAGFYYLLITPSGHLPAAPGNTPIFGDLTNTTTVEAAGSPLVIKKYGASGTTPSPVDSGKEYDLQLTGADFAQAPEPATIALIGFGLAGLGCWRVRRVRSQARGANDQRAA